MNDYLEKIRKEWSIILEPQQSRYVFIEWYSIDVYIFTHCSRSKYYLVFLEKEGHFNVYITHFAKDLLSLIHWFSFEWFDSLFCYSSCKKCRIWTNPIIPWIPRTPLHATKYDFSMQNRIEVIRNKLILDLVIRRRK